MELIRYAVIVAYNVLLYMHHELSTCNPRLTPEANA